MTADLPGPHANELARSLRAELVLAEKECADLRAQLERETELRKHAQDESTNARMGAAVETTMPATWAEYFAARREANKATRSAAEAWRVAGDRLTMCRGRMDSLEAWAVEADKVVPFVGESVSDVPVVITIPASE